MIKQVIVIRRDLKMRRGKEIAQGAHASLAGYRIASSLRSGEIVDEWFNTGSTKITLQARDEAHLLSLEELARKTHIPCHLVIDEGRTEFGNVPTITALALGPYFNRDIDNITAGYELY